MASALSDKEEKARDALAGWARPPTGAKGSHFFHGMHSTTEHRATAKGMGQWLRPQEQTCRGGGNSPAAASLTLMAGSNSIAVNKLGVTGFAAVASRTGRNRCACSAMVVAQLRANTSTTLNAETRILTNKFLGEQMPQWSLSKDGGRYSYSWISMHNLLGRPGPNFSVGGI